MGSLSKIMGMLPGMGQFKDQIENFDEREIDRVQALILSMTPAERANPKLIDGSRRARIARGSGRSTSEVNQLIVRFLEGQKMMRQMMGGGGVPGMPGMPGMRRASKQAKKTKKKPKGGRPGGSPAGAAGKQPPGLPLGTQPGSAGTGGGLGGLGGLPGNLPPGLGGEGGFRLPGPGPGSQPGPQHLPPGLRGGGANRRGKKGR